MQVLVYISHVGTRKWCLFTAVFSQLSTFTADCLHHPDGWYRNHMGIVLKEIGLFERLFIIQVTDQSDCSCHDAGRQECAEGGLGDTLQEQEAYPLLSQGNGKKDKCVHTQRSLYYVAVPEIS